MAEHYDLLCLYIVYTMPALATHRAPIPVHVYPAVTACICSLWPFIA